MVSLYPGTASCLKPKHKLSANESDIISSGESCVFKTTTMADTIEKASIQLNLYLIFLLILVRFEWSLKRIPRNNDSNRPIL